MRVKGEFPPTLDEEVWGKECMHWRKRLESLPRCCDTNSVACKHLGYSWARVAHKGRKRGKCPIESSLPLLCLLCLARNDKLKKDCSSKHASLERISI